MAVLNIRNLPAEVHARLRVRAARGGRSMEAEARAILAAVCMEGDSRRPASALQDWVGELYGLKKPRKVVDALITERRREAAKE